MSDAWLDEALESALPFEGHPTEDMLIAKLLDVIEQNDYASHQRPFALGAAFDLLVAVEYYGTVAHTGWLYCQRTNPLLLYPYTNTCPHCVLDGNFVFHKANKPRSGSIGAATSRLLGRFIESLLQRKNVPVQTLRGREPVDAIFIDRTTKPVTIFFVEVKASPLVTLPLAAKTQQMISEEQDDVLMHRHTDLTALFGTDLFLFLPSVNDSGSPWHGSLYLLGSKQDADDRHWAYRGLNDLLEHETFFQNYLAFWQQTLRTYENRDSGLPIYWLTNGCGQPNPRPDDWPRRSGTGYESISDGKTSVGMDRTDDIKKATYQVIKLGAQGKPTMRYSYKIGIVSNIHAIRHFDEYLDALKDIIWTRDTTGEVTHAASLPPETELYNLFDGIVTLTKTLARDHWVKTTFRL